ncbi:MAG: peptidylprolyl isomerase [Eubacteriales bacterium]|nr:peptidylprolyl isomerase [Eubacteriales bacterium]
MDEKEKELEQLSEENEEQNTNETEDTAVNDSQPESEEQADDTLEEKDGVKYETNDNWQFDASAPTLEDDLVLEDDRFEIDLKSSKESDSKSKKDDAEDVPAPQPAKKAKNKDIVKFVGVAIFVAAVIAVLAVLGVRYYTVPNGKEGDMMNPGSVVAEIDGTKVSTGMFNYYYSSMVSYYEQYAAYGYFDLDTTKDYSSQYTTDDEGNQITWEDFFIQECLKEIETTTAYYTAGKAAGVTLTASQQETLDSQMESLKTSASENGVSLDEYISANFGQYCSEETLELMLEQYYITANYKGMLSAQNDFSEEEINKYFDEHKDEYQQITFTYLAFPYDTTDDTTTKNSINKAKSYMSKMTDADAVKDLVEEVYADYIASDAEYAMESDSSITKEEATADAIATYEENTYATITGADSPFDTEVTNWLFSADTKVGSTNYYADESAGYIYVILKTEDASLLDDNTYTVRHILIQPESDDEETTEYTDEQWAAARTKADKVLEEYNKGDKTEFSFALLAEEYSSDTGSTSASSSDTFGGLYEGVTEGEMVPEFEDWSFDKSRKYGDTDIVKSDYGYHIMFFVRTCPSYEASIISDLSEQELDKIMDDADIKVNDKIVDNAVEEYNMIQEIQSQLDTSMSDTEE